MVTLLNTQKLNVTKWHGWLFQFANLFENNSSSEWLLYISEWNHKGQDLSNIRVTTKVVVNALLGDTPALRDYGSAIMHNLGTKEVKTMVCNPSYYPLFDSMLMPLMPFSPRCLTTSAPSWPWPSWSSSRASPTRTRCSGAWRPSTSSVPSPTEKCPSWSRWLVPTHPSSAGCRPGRTTS